MKKLYISIMLFAAMVMSSLTLAADHEHSLVAGMLAQESAVIHTAAYGETEQTMYTADTAYEATLGHRLRTGDTFALITASDTDRTLGEPNPSLPGGAAASWRSTI